MRPYPLIPYCSPICNCPYAARMLPFYKADIWRGCQVHGANLNTVAETFLKAKTLSPNPRESSSKLSTYRLPSLEGLNVNSNIGFRVYSNPLFRVARTTAEFWKF